MRWFEGIDLAQDLQAKEQMQGAGHLQEQDLNLTLNKMEAGSGSGSGGDGKGALLPVAMPLTDAAAAVRAINTDGKDAAAGATSLLPVSYLEGHRYYRAGADSHDGQEAAAAAPLDKDAAAHRDLGAAAAAGPQKHDDGDAPVRIHDPYRPNQDVAAGTTHESNTNLAPAPESAEATAAAGAGAGYPLAHHSELSPEAGGVLLTREAAEQEHREVEREREVELTHI